MNVRIASVDMGNNKNNPLQRGSTSYGRCSNKGCRATSFFTSKGMEIIETERINQ